MWNLFCLANAVYPLVGKPEPIKEALEDVQASLERASLEMVSAKLGLSVHSENDALWEQLESALQLSETDMTLFFRGLSSVPTDASATDEQLLEPLSDAIYVPDSWEKSARATMLDWLRAYTQRARNDARNITERKAAMDAVNPKYVLRNYLAQVAIDSAEQGDPKALLTLLDVMRNPYSEQPHYESYAAKRPEWARNRPGCSTLSCSS